MSCAVQIILHCIVLYIKVFYYDLLKSWHLHSPVMYRVTTRTRWSFTFLRGTGLRTSGSDALSTMRSFAVTPSSEQHDPRVVLSVVALHSGCETLYHYVGNLPRLSRTDMVGFYCFVSNVTWISSASYQSSGSVKVLEVGESESIVAA